MLDNKDATLEVTQDVRNAFIEELKKIIDVDSIATTIENIADNVIYVAESRKECELLLAEEEMEEGYDTDYFTPDIDVEDLLDTYHNIDEKWDVIKEDNDSLDER